MRKMIEPSTGGLEPGASPAGFSLVELVVAMVIVAALAGIAMPRYQNALLRYRVDRAAKRLVADFELIRSETRSLGASRSVLFDVGSDTYGVTHMGALDSSASTYSVDLADAPFHVDVVSADFGGDATVAFNGYGVPDSGGTVVLQAGTIQKTVTLDADTAKATVQ